MEVDNERAVVGCGAREGCGGGVCAEAEGPPEPDAVIWWWWPCVDSEFQVPDGIGEKVICGDLRSSWVWFLGLV